MSKTEIVGLIVTILGVGCFSVIFTLLYKSYISSEINSITTGRSDLDLIDMKIYDNLSKVKTRRKIISTIKSLVFYGLMIFIIPFFIFSIVNKIQGNITMIGNRGVLVVASGSMSFKNPENTYLEIQNLNNQFDKYDIIVIENVNTPYDLKLYDVISYINDEGKNIIHRIVDVGINDEGEVEFVTRGDSNAKAAVDKYRPTIKDIKGKYVGKRIPLAGMFILFMQSPLGLVTILALAYCLIIVEKNTRRVTDEQNKRLELLSSAIDFDENLKIDDLRSDFVERIYYKDTEYIFNDSGLLEKNKKPKAEALSTSEQEANNEDASIKEEIPDINEREGE